jgi:hypothetical protein
MKETHDVVKKTVNAEESQSKLKQADSGANSDNKSAESLGNGRWKFQGKTYKEEII